MAHCYGCGKNVENPCSLIKRLRCPNKSNDSSRDVRDASDTSFFGSVSDMFSSSDSGGSGDCGGGSEGGGGCGGD